jgi:hypothetical protein
MVKIVNFVCLGHMVTRSLLQDVRDVNVTDMVTNNEGYVIVDWGIVSV